MIKVRNILTLIFRPSKAKQLIYKKVITEEEVEKVKTFTWDTFNKEMRTINNLGFIERQGWRNREMMKKLLKSSIDKLKT